jgi:hypothetical protein
MNRYGEQPGSDVLALSHDLAQGDWITPKDQRGFENFAKPKDIQYIAQRLAAICDRPSLTHGERPSQQDSAIFWNQEKRARL